MFKKIYPSYEELKKMVRTAGIKSAKEYREWAKEQNTKVKTGKENDMVQKSDLKERRGAK